MIPLLCCAVMIASQAGAASSTAKDSAAAVRAELVEAWADDFMATALRQAQVAGAIVAVVQGDRVVLAKGFGFADIERKTPVDATRTGFRIGSVAKVVTATAVMQLVELGKLDLDRDVNEYLDFRIRSLDGSPITLRHLLTHSAGFDQVIKGLGYIDPKLVVPLPEYVRRYLPPRVYRPGTIPAYSNYGFVLAGYLIHRVSGETFEDYMDRRVFRPLGMSRSTFRQPLPPDLAPDMSKGYLVADGPTQPFEILGTLPAGGATSTASDMARFMIAHLQGGRFDSVSVLRPETARLMHSSAQSPPAPPGFAGMALGFMEGHYPARRSIGHGGDTIAFHAGLVLFLDAKIGVFVAINSLGTGVLAGDGVVNAAIDEFADRFVPRPSEPTPPAVATAEEHAAGSAGRYLSSRHFERSFLSLLNLRPEKVEANPDSTITIQTVVDRQGKPKRWREVAPWIWQETEGSDRLAMTVDGNRVVTIRRNGDPATVLLRAEGLRKAAWNVPLLLATIVVLLAEILRQVVRRVIRAIRPARLPPLTGMDRVALLGQLAAAVALAGWVYLLYGLLSGDIGLLSATRDPLLRGLQLTGAVAIVFLPATLLTTTRILRQAHRRFLGKLWSICVLLASVGFVWIAVAFHLLGPSLMY